MNRIQKYKLNARNAYEFACGRLVEDLKSNKLIYIYKRNKQGYVLSGKNRTISLKELSEDEQKIFINSPEWGYKYAWKFKKRLFKEVENNFLSIITKENLPRVLYYCKIFKMSVPETFHNFAIMSAAINTSPNDSKSKIQEKKSKRYIRDFERNKIITKNTIALFIANEWINERDTIKEALEKL
jgi:hypothetical protein